MPIGVYNHYKIRGRKRPPFSKEWIENLSKAHLGQSHPHTEESKRKMSEIRLKRKQELGYINSPETCKKIGDTQRGRVSPKKGIPQYHQRGENHWNWQGGIWEGNDVVRNSIEYKNWRIEVYKRDNYTCQECNEVGGRLNAHHIKSFAEYPELHFDVDNGKTLCVKCHVLK